MAHDDRTVLLEEVEGNHDQKVFPSQEKSMIKKQRKTLVEVIPLLITVMAAMILAGYLLIVKY